MCVENITSDSVIYYDTVEWDDRGFVPQDEIRAQEDEEMERVSLEFAVGLRSESSSSREVNLRE